MDDFFFCRFIFGRFFVSQFDNHKSAAIILPTFHFLTISQHQFTILVSRSLIYGGFHANQCNLKINWMEPVLIIQLSLYSPRRQQSVSELRGCKDDFCVGFNDLPETPTVTPAASVLAPAPFFHALEKDTTKSARFYCCS